MHDPTYDTEIIEANPIYELAFTISEIENDQAPIGWSRYIVLARLLLQIYEIERKEK